MLVASLLPTPPKKKSANTLRMRAGCEGVKLRFADGQRGRALPQLSYSTGAQRCCNNVEYRYTSSSQKNARWTATYRGAAVGGRKRVLIAGVCTAGSSDPETGPVTATSLFYKNFYKILQNIFNKFYKIFYKRLSSILQIASPRLPHGCRKQVTMGRTQLSGSSLPPCPSQFSGGIRTKIG